MDKYFLTLPDESYSVQIMEYRSECLEYGTSMDGSGPLKHTQDPAIWIENSLLYMNKEAVPEGFVQTTQFLYVRESDNRLCGMIQVRHSFNEYLEKYAGNIGYNVRSSMRRQGIATLMLCDCLKFCKSIGLERILISCYTDNVAGRKVILANIGVYESCVTEPKRNKPLERYWITL